MANTVLQTYRHRVPPQGYDSGWLNQEFVNVEQRIAGSAANGLGVYQIMDGETGVVDQRYPVGHARRYGVQGTQIVDDAPAIQNGINSLEALGAPRPLWFDGGMTCACYSGLSLRNVSLAGPTGPGAFGKCAALVRYCDGDFITVDGTAGLSYLLIDDPSVGANRTGAALRYLYHVIGGVPYRAGLCTNIGVRITDVDPAGAWERVIDIDGTQDLDVFGARDIAFLSCWFFGARTVDSSIRIRKGVHIQFVASGLFPAPTAVRQGVSIDVDSVDIEFSNFDMIGTLTSHGTNVNYIGGKVGNDALSTSIDIASDAVNNTVITALVTGSAVNSSATSLVVPVGTGGIAGMVSLGAADSGGVGFRVLRVPN